MKACLTENLPQSSTALRRRKRLQVRPKIVPDAPKRFETRLFIRPEQPPGLKNCDASGLRAPDK